MRYRLISILFLLAAIDVQGKTGTAIVEAITSNANNMKQGTNAQLSRQLVTAMYSGGDITKIYYFSAIELGYASVTTNATNIKRSGGGFSFNVEYGCKIELPGRNEQKTSLLSFAISFAPFFSKERYIDNMGHSVETDRSFYYIGLPVIYTHMGRGIYDEHGCFYWQAGAKFNYLGNMDENGDDAKRNFSKFMLQPCASLGWCFPFDVKRKKEVIGQGMMQLGPFASYAVTNMSKLTGVTMNAMIVGIRYTYIFL